MVRASEYIFTKFLLSCGREEFVLLRKNTHSWFRILYIKIIYLECVYDDVIWDAARSISIAYKPANK